MINALTIDLEEWHDTVLFSGAPQNPAGNFRANTEQILSLLDKRKVKATFFMLGRLAEAYPETARAITAAGHELASHGYKHKSLWRLTAEEFAADLARSREAIISACGAAPAGYRAPTWSLKGREKEFLPLIRDAGFAYDSSLYGLGPGASQAPYAVIEGLTEFPPSVFKCCGLGLPFLGGTFLRWAGPGFLSKQVAGLNRAGLPAMLYFHSWEFDPEPPPGLSFYKRAVQYYNVKSVPLKADALLGAFSWAPIRDILKL
jgi:polysaccharide deacetylase family protein (PEP-CTERM system associated)